jgi:carboxypeptidase C (cathepsin A)
MGSSRLAFIMLSTVVAALRPAAAQQPARPAPDSTPRPAPAESASVTQHSVTIDGQLIKYTARAGTLQLKNDSGAVTGSMFYVAYTKDGSDLRRRPVTFAFNGGPGSSSVWLHMGSFAPVRVITSEAEPTPPPPYTVAENPQSLIDRTDLVFIDAIGTGFSRIVGKGQPKDFFGTDQDIRAFGDFILRYATVFGRWNSPKYLLGESYGTTRAAGLANALAARGMSLNGLVLVSSWLNSYVDFGSPPYSLEITYQLYLPTMAATAWYHHKLPQPHPQLAPFLEEVRAFALGAYQQALGQGSRLSDRERDSVVARLHQYTGLSEEFIRRARLRITPDRFQKELLRNEARTAGRLDARFVGIDHDAAGEAPEFDAADVAIRGPFTSAFNQYLQAELHYDGGTTYLTSNYPVVSADWDNRHRVAGGRWPIPDVSEDLRQAMSQNPYLRIFSANGYYDFATPFFETEYTLQHMGLEPSLEKNITYGYYESGHMIYLHQGALVQLKKDLAAWYDGGQQSAVAGTSERPAR